MLKLDVGIPDPGKPQKKAPKKTVSSLSQFSYMLSLRNLPSPIAEEIMKIAKGYPEGALDFVYQNLETFIQKCLKKKKPEILPIEPEPEIIMPEVTKKTPLRKEIPQIQRQSLFEMPPVLPEILPTENPKPKIKTEEEILKEMMEEIPRSGNPRKGDDYE